MGQTLRTMMRRSQHVTKNVKPAAPGDTIDGKVQQKVLVDHNSQTSFSSSLSQSNSGRITDSTSARTATQSNQSTGSSEFESPLESLNSQPSLKSDELEKPKEQPIVTGRVRTPEKNVKRDEGASKLHRSTSEPFKKPVTGTDLQMHKTRSEVPFKQFDVGLKKTRRSTMPEIAEAATSSKHMEGNLNVEADTNVKATERKQGTEPEAILEKNKDELCEDLSMASVSKNSSHRAEKSRSEATHSSETTRTESQSADYSSNEAMISKLLKHMEIVSKNIKRKMNPSTFPIIQKEFVSKILNTCDVQYGFINDSYVRIGQGEFGEVMFGRLKHSHEFLAIKALKKDKSDMFGLLHEAFMLQLATHTDYAPKYFGLLPADNLGSRVHAWAMVLQFIGDPNSQPQPYDFRKTLKKAKEEPICDVPLILTWIYTAAKVVHAVQSFHRLGMLVNDIKADNILLKPVPGQGYHPIFVDFGLASVDEGITLALEVDESNKEQILKEYSHIAPEVLFGGETNIKSDIFSMGKALSLISDAFPISHFSNTISRCCNWNAYERPNTEELLSTFHWIAENIIR